MSAADHSAPDLLHPEASSALGHSPIVFHAADVAGQAHAPYAVNVALDPEGRLPALDKDSFDVLLTTAPSPPAPWVGVTQRRFVEQVRRVETNVIARPVAATILVRLLRTSEHLDFDAALEMESLAYSTLLGGQEFAAWLGAQGVRTASAAGSPPFVRFEREDDRVTLWLARPEARNAMSAALRDALYEALANTLDDPTARAVELRGEGRCFSVGGDLAEFGSARDLARAHLIRSLRSCARLLHRLGDRAATRLHGPCIGAGVEIGAAAARRTIEPGAYLQLPELHMGLIPGAGGTVTLPRAIGRHRTVWMALTSQRVGARLAVEWGFAQDSAT